MNVLKEASVFVHSYTLRVVGSGIKAQSSNPEVKVKGADPVVHQIIDKLKHINQVSLLILHVLFVSSTPPKVYVSIPHSVRRTVTVSLGTPLIHRVSSFYGTLSVAGVWLVPPALQTWLP